jgi:hypothetical protein
MPSGLLRLMNSAGYYADSACSGTETGSLAVPSGSAPVVEWASRAGAFLTTSGTASVLVACQSAGFYDVWVDGIWLKLAGAGTRTGSTGTGSGS